MYSLFNHMHCYLCMGEKYIYSISTLSELTDLTVNCRFKFLVLTHNRKCRLREDD